MEIDNDHSAQANRRIYDTQLMYTRYVAAPTLARDQPIDRRAGDSGAGSRITQHARHALYGLCVELRPRVFRRRAP